jgi:hypothetical protein
MKQLAKSGGSRAIDASQGLPTPFIFPPSPMTSARHFLNDGVCYDGCVSRRKLSKEFIAGMSHGKNYLIYIVHVHGVSD